MIETIRNGFGNITQITYESLSNSSHYTRADIDAQWTITSPCDNLPPEALIYNGGHEAYCRFYRGVEAPEFYKYINNPFNLEADHPEYGRPIFEVNSAMPIVTRVESNAGYQGNINNTRGEILL